MNRRLAELQARQPLLAAQITGWADNFEYEKIQTLCEAQLATAGEAL